MAHISLADLIKHTVCMRSLSTHKSGQIQVIAVGDGIFSYGKAIVIVVFQYPFCLFHLLADHINVCLQKLIHLTLCLDLPNRSHLLCSALYPVVQSNPSADVPYIFF